MNFKEYHCNCALKTFKSQTAPLDSFLRGYFRSHKALGSKDKAFVTENLYHYIRWENLFEYLEKSHLDKLDPFIYEKDLNIPTHIRYGVPKFLYDLLKKAYGEQETKDICRIMNTRAPLTIRINPGKTSRSLLLKTWENIYNVSPCLASNLGICFHQKINLKSLQEFKQGLFEIQDESCQLASQIIKAKPFQNILDYCSGSGGKALAVAHLLQNKGNIYIHDSRNFILKKSIQRFDRAGIKNMCILSLPPKETMDWVIVDVPCSGTGALRRNPDFKWKIDRSMLQSLLDLQREIFDQSLKYLKPEGQIVYMTCSILPQENEEQLAFFQKKYSLELVNLFKTLPVLGGMDGFFAASLKKLNKKSALC